MSRKEMEFDLSELLTIEHAATICDEEHNGVPVRANLRNAVERRTAAFLERWAPHEPPPHDPPPTITFPIDPHLKTASGVVAALEADPLACVACRTCGRAKWMHSTRHDTCAKFTMPEAR